MEIASTIEIINTAVNILSTFESVVLNDSFTVLNNAPNSTTNLSASGIMLLLTCAPIASEIENTDRTIRTGDNRIPNGV